MNYRHQYHAGNFADVMKHVLLLQLVRAMQRKETGFLYLDTHAGRGSYDLAVAAQGDTRQREPEWPAGIGRLWNASQLSALLADYVAVVRDFDRRRSNREATPRYYPGSPALVAARAREQDRLVLCERHPEEAAALANEMSYARRTSVQTIDGYIAPRAVLPPPEKRALVLIDPPFEAQDEFARIVTAVEQGLARLPAGVFAVWYPLTERARIDAFAEQLRTLPLPPTSVYELTIAGETTGLKMRGCGLVVINPPWQFEAAVMPALHELAELLQQESGATARCHWLAAET